MKKLLALVLVLVLSLSAFGAMASAEGDRRTELNIAMSSSPETIDPNRNSSVDGAVYAIHNFEGLMRYKWDGDGVEYGMAESYDVSDDGMVWTFHLRDSKWSDGEPVKAQDFEFSWKRLVDPELGCPYAGDMGSFIKNGLKIATMMNADGLTKEEYIGIKAEAEGLTSEEYIKVNGEEAAADGFVPLGLDDMGVKAIDDKTFEVTLEDPCPFFAEIAAFPVFMPIRQDIIEKYGDDNWVKTGESYVSNGAFMMESFTLDDRMITVPNPGYWDAASVVPTKITWLFLSDDKAELAALRAGEADFVDAVPQEEVQALKADGLYDLRAELGTYYVSFNTQKAPFDDVNVRKAFTLAMDTDFIANVLREGEVMPAVGFVGYGFRTSGASQDFRDGGAVYVDPSNYEANIVAAQEALAAAGYPNGEGFPKVEYSYNDNTAHAAIGEALQKMWQDVLGVQVELHVSEWSVFLADRREGNYEIARNGWIGDYNDPATMLTLTMSTSGNNDGKYNSAAYDAKMSESMAETDPDKRDALLHEAEDIMMGDWAAGPIYYYTDGDGVSPQLTDWGKMPLAYKMFHRTYVDLTK